ncbi:MAG: lysophospholipid acyltransferase family protein [Pseudomonadota bacterium]
MKFPELSYANSEHTPLQRWIIHRIEQLSGRDYFVPLYEVWRNDVVGKSDAAIAEMLHLLKITLSIHQVGQWPPDIKADEPLVMIANHPYGIADGIAMLSLAEQLGRPFKVLINKDLLKVPEILPYGIPIDFDDNRNAMETNMRSRQVAIDLLRSGTTIIVFPAGGVATASNPFGRAQELPWKNFTARLIRSAEASVLPIYFEGQNGFVFHLASRLSLTLRVSFLIAEFRRMAGKNINVHIGPVTSFETLQQHHKRKALTQELYELVHNLEPENLSNS